MAVFRRNSIFLEKSVNGVWYRQSSLRILTQSLARELGPKGVHAVHLVLDGLIDNERTRKLNPHAKDENYMKMRAIAKTIYELITQDRSAWTQELDMRPYTEKF